MYWTLIRKDIAQHAQPLGFLFASAFALPPAFSLLSISDSDGAGYSGIVFGFLALGAPMLFGQWFIGQEKTKGTFRLLCSFPISGARIIMAKYLGSLLPCLGLINGALLLEPALCRSLGLNVPQPAVALVVGTNLTAGLLVSISITLFTLLDVRVASQAIIWSMCILMLSISLAGRFLQRSRIETLTGGDLRLIFDPPIVAMAGILFACLPIALAGLAPGSSKGKSGPNWRKVRRPDRVARRDDHSLRAQGVEDMTDRPGMERFVYIFVLASSVLLVVVALTNPDNSLWRKLYDVVLATCLMAVSAWQLLKLRKH